MISGEELFATAGVTKNDRDQESDVRYYRFRFDGKDIHLEVTAANMMSDITCFPVEAQEKLVGELAKRVPEVGDSELLIMDEEDRKNRRGGRLVRLRPANPDSEIIHLLMTR